MNMTNDLNERRKQKEILRSMFSDYDAKHHDVFVGRYNKEVDKQSMAQYVKNRDIK